MKFIRFGGEIENTNSYSSIRITFQYAIAAINNNRAISGFDF